MSGWYLMASQCNDHIYVLQGWWGSFVFIPHLVLSKPLFFSNSGVETQDPAGMWQKQSWSLALAFGIALPPVETNPSAVSRTACQWLSQAGRVPCFRWCTTFAPTGETSQEQQWNSRGPGRAVGFRPWEGRRACEQRMDGSAARPPLPQVSLCPLRKLKSQGELGDILLTWSYCGSGSFMASTAGGEKVWFPNLGLVPLTSSNAGLRKH